eukprot:4399103-Amphidinium_carterae.1
MTYITTISSNNLSRSLRKRSSVVKTWNNEQMNKKVGVVRPSAKNDSLVEVIVLDIGVSAQAAARAHDIVSPRVHLKPD